MSQTYIISSRIYYNNILQCYSHIYILDRSPTTPFNNIVKTLHTPKLSPFKESTPCSPLEICVNAIYNPNSTTELLKKGEEAILFTYLLQNGYTINTSLTKIMKDDRILCVISK